MDGYERSYHPADGTKGKFLDRLRDEGRRAAFDTRLAELKSAGPKNKAARQQAFWQGVHEFAPPPADEPSPQPADETETEPSLRPSPALVNAAAFANKDALPSIAAIGWVSANIAVDGVREGSSPDAASWALLQWVRKAQNNEHTFWRMLFPLVVRSERTEERPSYEPPDPKAHGKVMAQIVEITDAAYGRSEGALAQRFIQNPSMWLRIRDFVENALQQRREHESALQPIISNIPRQRRSESEAEFLTETERWVAEDPDRRWKLLRDHMRLWSLPVSPGRARAAPAESAETQLQSTELESA